jgi:hypothetical protein
MSFFPSKLPLHLSTNRRSIGFLCRCNSSKRLHTNLFWAAKLKVFYPRVYVSIPQGLHFALLLLVGNQALVNWSVNRPYIIGPPAGQACLDLLRRTCGLFICSGRQLPSARRQGVFGYPIQSAEDSVGSVLKWCARPQCLRSKACLCLADEQHLWHGLFICSEDSLPSARRHAVFGYPKQSATVSVGSVLNWRARPQCLRSKACQYLADEQHN